MNVTRLGVLIVFVVMFNVVMAGWNYETGEYLLFALNFASAMLLIVNTIGIKVIERRMRRNASERINE